MKFYRAGIHPYYVDILKNKNERAMISKLRISAHKLAIEGGRYLKSPKHERMCSVLAHVIQVKLRIKSIFYLIAAFISR